MKRSKKLKRVSWASGSNLCQVKLFLSEDCPSIVGKKSQDHLQAKTMSIGHSITNEYDDLPPGFEENHFRNQSKAELSHISHMKWECPSLFTLSSDWRVAAGEDSREKYDQKLREMRVLEAVYPRISAIPLGPFVSFDVEKECYDDSLTPLIPLTPVEEEEESVEDIEPDSPIKKLQSQNLQQHYIPPATSLINSQCSGKPLVATSSKADIVAAAASAAAVAAIIKSNEQGSLIDMDLLLKIFNDPTMIEKLIEETRTATTTVSAPSNILSIPTSYSKSATSSIPLSSPTPAAVASGTRQATPEKPAITFDKPVTATATPSVPLSKPVSPQTVTTQSVTRHTPPSIPTPHMHKPVKKNIPHMPNGVLPSSNTHSPQQGLKRAAPLASVSPSELNTVTVSSASANMHAVAKQVQSTTTGIVKDVNYYKNLVRKHGTHKQDKKRHNNFKDLKRARNYFIKPQGEVKFKSQKPCIYFRTLRGCRNGSNCPYQHDLSNQWEAGNILMPQNAKRLKVGPEIKGRT